MNILKHVILTQLLVGYKENLFQKMFSICHQEILQKLKLNFLIKGLGFVLTPGKINRWQLKFDLEKFGRNFRLRIDFVMK